jgi:hypothetical protein
MPCIPCAMALLAADGPTIGGLVSQARANPHLRACLCPKCRRIMGADDGGFATWGTGGGGSGSGSDPAIPDLSQTLANAGGSAGGQSSPSGSSTGGTTGLSAQQIIDLAMKGLAIFNGPPGTPPQVIAPPPVAPVVPQKPASDQKAWVIALIALVLIILYVLSTRGAPAKKR